MLSPASDTRKFRRTWLRISALSATLDNSLPFLYAFPSAAARLRNRACACATPGNFSERETHMNEPKLWEELYAAAVLETDSKKIADRIDQAQDALRQRWQILHETPHANDRERRRLEDAMRTLNLIREAELRTSA